MTQGSSAFDLQGLRVKGVRRRGMGLAAAIDTYEDQPWLGPAPTPTKPATTTEKSGWDKLLDIVKTGGDVYSSVKTPTYPGGGYNNNNFPPPQTQSNTMKYVAIGGAVLLIGGITVYALHSSKKK